MPDSVLGSETLVATRLWSQPSLILQPNGAKYMNQMYHQNNCKNHNCDKKRGYMVLRDPIMGEEWNEWLH